jgi:ribosomal protein S18 acetylase RimI-like enzyme
MIELRKAELTDIRQLQEISRQTFVETFAAVNTEENMLKYLEEAFSTEKLTAELNDPNSEFLFAMRNDEVAGYLKINYGASQTDVKDDQSLEIERIYVLEKFKGNGIGKRLYTLATEIALGKNLEYIWLGVWEENHNAIRFYRKLGIVEFGNHAFLLGDDEQTDIMMRIPVR